MIRIDVFFLSGCSRCGAGLGGLKAVADSFGPDAFIWQERNLLENIDDAVQLGILVSPAIAISGKLAFTGALPSAEQLHIKLSEYVSA